MKYLFSFLLVAAAAGASHAQTAFQQTEFASARNLYRSPVFKDPLQPFAPPKFAGRGQKILGISLTFGGMAIMIVGGAEIAIASALDNSNSTSDERSIIETEGAILLVVGAAATTTGIIFWKKGASNMRGAIQRSSGYQQSLSLNLKGAGAGLKFRF